MSITYWRIVCWLMPESGRGRLARLSLTELKKLVSERHQLLPCTALEQTGRDLFFCSNRRYERIVLEARVVLFERTDPS